VPGVVPATGRRDARGVAGEGLLGQFLAWIVPSTCAGCGSPRTGAGGAGACPACWASIPELDPARGCPGCALPGPGGTCRACRRSPSPLEQAAAFGAYEGTLKRLIGAYKFRGFDLLAAPFAERLVRLARRSGLAARADALVAVPSTGRRNRERGFDPAPLLAREAARRLAVPLLRPLRRSRATPPQSTLSRSARLVNVAGAFEARAYVAGRSLLLVDDIVTTGATAFAAAAALRRSGASHVDLLVLARTLAPEEKRPSESA